ncbi:heteromeric transposase endonuclease subunit TnsA [Pseudoalteromonas luteoviolacea]|uniref:TnsA endonuclease N-terminal domain-containing protein n=1 Tax=Pseudoalteromonas luteoviolacea DSM 6061 TaxID=1365250 RepID=A0A166YI00_9GAMM|nr:heteromeric transposase endonuclease subunit TnsA [Pseudoalteromonas luteoviolacea]KZN42650.1 hypothetical protein N475_09985 [Pseudoalteromonas luteoviolacea DSM 6061]MBE0385155.1 hypothetical protein [Pseudoalteromonas luteoviolacea DSM 6061]
MPVRTIPKNYRNVTGIAAHSKADGQAMFESTLERDFISLLEFDKHISRFEVQPVKIICLNNEDKRRSYTPDVLAFRQGEKPTLYEVKYRSELKENWGKLRPKFRMAIKYAKENQWKFKIVTEKEIRTPYLESVKFLLPFIRQGASEEADMALLVGNLKTLGRTTPTELLEKIYSDPWNQARLLPTLWYLIGTGQIGMNLNQKITMTQEIWS